MDFVKVAKKVATLKVTLELLFTLLILKIKGRGQMETNMQQNLDKENSPTITNLWHSLGSIKRKVQTTEKSDISGKRDVISQVLEYGILCFLFLLSIVLRISLYKVINGDYYIISSWYNYIKGHGGFAALRDGFGVYTMPYIYILAVATYFPIDLLVVIKTTSVFFDLALALLTYLILRLKYQQSCIPILGAIIILFTPTVFINSAAWGQNDATYAAWCLASLYCLLSKRPAWACVFFGLAISFKPQAVFFLPVLLVLFLARKLPFRYLILIPVVVLALLVPAELEGRGIWSLLNIYVEQTKEFSGDLVLKAPTFYQWIPAGDPENWVQMGEILATAMVALISFLAVRSRRPITPEIILKLTLIFAVAIPFFLPEMHERYFYLADVVSIIYAFYFPRYFYLAIIEQLCSCMSVIPSLFGQYPTINLAYVAFAVLFIIVVTVTNLVKTLFPTSDESAAMPCVSRNDLSATITAPVLFAEDTSNMTSSTALNNGLSVEETSKMDFSAEPKEKEEISERFSL
jgi:Gpi18-like mannosyltransferase